MKKRLIVLLLAISLIVSGCWSSIELDTLSIILGAAVDKSPAGDYEVTLQTAKNSSNPGKGEGNEPPSSFIIQSGKGKSFFDAARNITLNSPRRNYWPHNLVLIVNEKMAQEGLESLLDFYTRDSQRRQDLYLILTDKNSKDLLSAKTEFEPMSSIELQQIIQETNLNSYGVNINLHNFIKQSQELSGVSLINRFPFKNKKISLDGTGVFYQYKLKGYLTKEETRGYNFLTDRIKTGVITLNYEKNNQDDITLEITNSQTELQPTIKNNRYLMQANIFIEGNIAEYSGKESFAQLSIAKINSLFAQKTQNNVNQTFHKAQENLQVDPFHFGQLFAAKYPELSKLTHDQWRELFINNVDLKVNVKVDITSMGETMEKLK